MEEPRSPSFRRIGLMWTIAACLGWLNFRDLRLIFSGQPLENPLHAYAGLACVLLTTLSAALMSHRRWKMHRKSVTTKAR